MSTAILALAVLFAFLFVQGYFSVGPNAKSASSAVENGLQLFMTLDANRTSVQQGEQIKLTLALANLSNQTKTLTDVNGNSIFNFEVYNSNSNNDWIYMYYVGAYPIINTTIIIPPYANYNETFTWGQDGTFGHPSQEPVGTYYFEGNTNDNGSIPVLQTSRLSVDIRYPLLEIAVVFSTVVIAAACIFIILLVYHKHRKTANLRQ